MADPNDLMTGRIANVTLIALAAMILSCLISMMAVFMADNLSGSDLEDLLFLQAATIPIASIVFALSLSGFVRERGWRHGLRQLWDSTPPWLVFVVASLLSLVGVGELSFYLIRSISSRNASFFEHVPLLCLLSSTAAFTALFAAMNPFDKSVDRPIGRWPPAAR